MRLKKLELFGFKSFADRTEVVFDRGVTAIVGPNGCGKSNISDAIRWVLGERSAKLLRGAKMEDVIFNGTDFRKPLALAEVSLTIDNQDRGLPIDYQEVTITRRLYRSGESEYLVNKTACRLKDIQDLILDTGIGSSSYSMIEQGRIDYILNADAEERRFLIEEAAGISKYKVKKEEAIRKLEKTEENRLRLNDIVAEVYRNIQYAERQAKRAERYREFFEKLKTMEIKKAFYDQGAIRNDLNRLETEREVKKQELAVREAEMAEFRARQEALLQVVREIAEQHTQEDVKRQTIQSRIDQITQILSFHQEKRMEMATRRGQVDQESVQLAAQIAKNEQEIAAKQRELELLTGEREQTYQANRQSEEALKAIEAELLAAKDALETIKIESLEAAADLVQFRNEYHRLSAFVETRHEQKKHRQANAVRLQQEAGQWKSKETSCLEELRMLEEKLSLLKTKKEDLSARLKSGRDTREWETQEKQRLERLCHEHETQLKWLEELESVSTQQEADLLTSDDGFRRECIKTLREVVAVKPGYEWALESALDSFANLLIAENREAVEWLAERLQTKKFPAVGLMVRQADVPARVPAMLAKPENSLVVCSLEQVVDVRSGYEDVLVPLLSRTFIVQSSDHVETLRQLWDYAADYRFVAPNGLLFGPERRILVKGGHGVHEGMSLERSARIETLRRDAATTKTQISELMASLERRSHELEALAHDEEAVSTEMMDATLQKESFDSLRLGMEERIGSFQRELDLLFMETQEMQNQQEEAMAKRATLETALHQAEVRERKIAQTQNDLIVKIESLDQKKTEALKRFAEAKVRWEKFEEKLNLLQGSWSVLTDSNARDQKRVEQLALERSEMDQREVQLQAEDGALTGEGAEQEQARREADVALEMIRMRKDAAEKELSEFQKAMEEIRVVHETIRESLHEYEMKTMDLNFQERAIAERLLQTYRLRLADFNPADYPVGDSPIDEMMAEIEALREKVEKLGTVNLLAIEEYEELKQRYDFLLTQQKDLEDAKNALLETIRKINRTTKGLFEETFKNVQIAFQHYYETLFQGGYARLVLLDEENPIESGIDIVVRPPAKKPTHISLLSGGEKALTAIALLLALFKIKPSPFCVLDEVDAPLDEANVDRFILALREFLTVSQFIIVTHNRKTIAMGDSLFGVTMQEPGISKIVSVKVNADAGSAESSEDDEMSLDELIDDGADDAVPEENVSKLEPA